MRFLCFLFLVAAATAVVLFALQNQQVIHVGFYEFGIDASVAAVVGAAYLLGMLSGWSFVGMLRRSYRRLTEESERNYAQTR